MHAASDAIVAGAEETMKKPIAAILATLAAASIWGQTGATRIPIAVPDFSVLSADVKAEDAVTIQELLANALSNEPIFELLERKQVTEIFNEVAFQVMTPGAMDSGVSQRLMGARALLIGSVGRLYGRTVITTRLVDLESGLVLFANNIYANDSEIAESISTLVSAIRDKGFEMTLRPTEADVARQVKAGNFSEAKKIADIYLRSNPDSAAVRASYPAIIAGLADEYYKQARSQLKRQLFDDARSKINQALALKVDQRFYAFREQIETDEEDWNFRQAILETRRKDELARRASGVTSSWDSLGSWYDKLDAEGAHLGAVYAPDVDPAALVVDIGTGFWGGEAFWMKTVTKGADSTAMLNWMLYAGGAVVYAPGLSGATITGNAYLSPLFAQSVRLGNVVLALGLDGGAAFRYGGDAAPGGTVWSAAATGGGLVSLTIKAWERLGLYLAAKADFAYYPEDPSRNGPTLRLSSGLSF